MAEDSLKGSRHTSLLSHLGFEFLVEEFSSSYGWKLSSWGLVADFNGVRPSLQGTRSIRHGGTEDIHCPRRSFPKGSGRQGHFARQLRSTRH